MNILYCGDKPMQKGILLSSMSLIKNVDEPLNIYILTVDYREKGINYKPVDKAFAKYLKEKLNKSDIKVNIFLVDVTRYFVEELPEANMQSRFTACCMLRLLLIRQILRIEFFIWILMCCAEKISGILLSEYGWHRDCGSF